MNPLDRFLLWTMDSRLRARQVGAALVAVGLLLPLLGFVASAANAVHDTAVFELDGNVQDDASAGEDWSTVYTARASKTAGSIDSVFIADPDTGADATYFFQGGSKDDLDLPSWKHRTTDEAPDKNSIENAFAASYATGDGVVVTFGADRFTTEGDAKLGFWFLQQDVSLNADGTFSGVHAVGDVLVQSNFTNGGTIDTLNVYEWVGSGGSHGTLDLVRQGVRCGAAAMDDVCAVVSGDSGEQPPWPYDPKFGTGYGGGAFFEAGMKLDSLFPAAPCFSTFLVSTRTSQEFSARLKDFAIGDLETCATPRIATTPSATTVRSGDAVTDSVTVDGPLGAGEGTVAFFVCGPNAAGACETGGTPVSVETLAAGKATSDPVTPTAAGRYCFRAEYTRSGGPRYVDATHTDAQTECFTVVRPQISIVKSATDATVDAGDDVEFSVTVTNSGTVPAENVALTDPLPGGGSFNWSMAPRGDCSISGAVGSQSLGCMFGTLAPGDSRTVKVTSPTSAAASCSATPYVNVAAATATGADRVTDDAAVTVQCAAIDIEKTATNSPVTAGDPVRFAMTVTNKGTGTARGVTVTDTLPAGLAWTENDDRCSIAAGTLTCRLADLAAGATAPVITISAPTTAAHCGVVDNTAVVTTTNDGTDSDTATAAVNCGTVALDKVADAGTVNAGEAVGFTIKVTNNGTAELRDVEMTDTLPTTAGTAWTIDGGTMQSSCGIAAGKLTCTLATLAAKAERTVHISSPTTSASCPSIDNTAHVTTGNDGSASDAASITVECPALSITKDAQATAVDGGDQVGYTIVVRNAGPGVAKAVVLNDPLPVKAGISWTISPAVPGCSISDDTLACAFGDMAANATRSVTVVSPTTAKPCATLQLTNTASAKADNHAAVQDAAAITVRCPELLIAKTADAAIVDGGSPIGFTVTVTSKGPGTAKAVTLDDPLPAGPAWTIASADPTCAITTGRLRCTWGDMAPDTAKSVRITAPTAATPCVPAQYPNTATAAGSNHADVSASATTAVQCAALTITKVADAAQVDAGNPIGFTVTVKSAGPAAAKGVTLRDPLPVKQGITWTVESADPTCAVSGSTTQTLSCTWGDMAAGTSKSVHVVAATPVTSSCTDSVFDNTATATAVNHADVTATAVTRVRCVDPGLTITKAAGSSQVNAGSPIAFSITVTSTGPGVARGVTLTDPLPTGSGISWAIASPVAGCGIEAGTLRCDFGDMSQGQMRLVQISSPTTEASCATYINTASVGATNHPPVSSTASTEVVCEQVPPLTIDIDKTGPALAHVGDVITYTMVVTNTGAVPLVRVAMTDPNCDATTVSEPSPADGTMEVGEQWTYSCTRTIRADDPDPLPNIASVVGFDSRNRRTTDADPHEVDIIRPAINIVKTANPTRIATSGPVTYTYVVTNTGDVRLTGVDVTDDIIGFIGVIGTLEPGASATLTKTVNVDANTPPVNIGTTRGTDPLGLTVTAEDDARITVVLGVTTIRPNDPDPTIRPFVTLPRTGGPLGGAKLVELGVALVLSGLGLVGLSLRRRNAWVR